MHTMNRARTSPYFCSVMAKNDIDIQPYPPPPVDLGVTGPSTSVPVSVPDYPLVGESEIPKFLNTQLLTQDLNEISPWLLLFQTPSSNISPLHHQIVRQREIVITEKIGLHLLWHTNRIFIKPLPLYLFNDKFREKYVDSNPNLKSAVGGFLHSYTCLIQSPSDMYIAVEKKLLPKEAINEPDKLFTLLKRYKGLPDEMMSPRFQYGELQLSRINFFIKIYRLQPGYHEVHGQYRTYFGRFMGPFLFIFGTVSVILSAMQVFLAATQDYSTLQTSPHLFEIVSKWFSVTCIGIVVAMIFMLGVLFIGMAFHQGAFVLIHGVSRWGRRCKRELHSV
ncbi:hypothetical protein DFP73DRAFT_561979 [Morchella snyderi]|nr:hypothetical protein DFP73DRAFT_561979 [Morchella snyderi]